MNTLILICIVIGIKGVKSQMYDLDKFEEEHTTYFLENIKTIDLKLDGRKRFKLIFTDNPRIIFDVSGV